MKYSVETNGFYADDVQYAYVPSDVVQITDEEYWTLLKGQSEGKRIVLGNNGRPVLGEPLPPSYEDVAEQVRSQRNRLLAESDWTQMPDAPVDRSAWAVYRQALREVPQQPGFPFDVVWPEAPA
jgi:hypothetical protein